MDEFRRMFGHLQLQLQLVFLLSSFASLIISNYCVHCLTAPSDILALQSFRDSIKPESVSSWSCLASWNFTTDPCAIPRLSHFTCGIRCSPDSTRVTEITLDPAGYHGTLTPSISHLTQLTILELSDNSFFGPIPSSISSLPNLRILTLQSNSFSGSVPPSITNLKSLESLDLNHNSLSGSLPISMSSLSNLKRLDLSYNKLTGSLPKLPPNLLELALKRNSLSGPLYKSSFDGLSQLEVIELSENSLTGPLESWFFLLTSLQQVNLANNHFTRVDISRPVGGDSNLVAVDLGYNNLEGYAPANFAAYPMLSSLTLRHNRLRGRIPMQYSQCKYLRRLFLDGNFFAGKPPQAFFAGGAALSGSLGDNCLQSCPGASQLCSPAQKPVSVCKQAYRGKPRS